MPSTPLRQVSMCMLDAHDPDNLACAVTNAFCVTSSSPQFFYVKQTQPNLNFRGVNNKNAIPKHGQQRDFQDIEGNNNKMIRVPIDFPFF